MSDAINIFMSFLGEQERSLGRLEATQVEIRGAVTQPPSQAPPETQSVREAKGGASTWTSLSRPLNCAVHHPASGQGQPCSQV